MARSKVGIAKRACVRLIVSLALLYKAKGDVNRDSDDSAVLKASRKVVLKVHPDKGLSLPGSGVGILFRGPRCLQPPTAVTKVFGFRGP